LAERESIDFLIEEKHFGQGFSETWPKIEFSEDGAGGFFPVGICVLSVEAVKQEVLATSLRHITLGS